MVKHRLHVWWWLSRKQDRLRYIKSICLNIDSGSNRNLYAASASISISFTSGPRQLCWMQSLMIVFQRQRPLCCMISRRPSRPRCWWRRPPPPWLCPAPFPPHPAQNAPRVPAPVQLCRQLHSPRPRLTSWTTPRQVWTSLYKQCRPDIALHFAKPLITNLSDTHLYISRETENYLDLGLA